MRLRWRFPAESEAAARAEVEVRIAAWWQAFEAKAKEIEALFAQRAQFDLEAWLTPRLRTIHEQLFWEFSRASGRWTFIITCEEQRELQPLVDRIVALAPGGLFCDVLNARPAELTTFALRTVEGRFEIDATKWTAALAPVGHGLIGVTWHGATDDEHEAAVWLTKVLLGEHEMADWVGAVVPGGRSLMSKLFGRSSRVGVADFVEAFSEAKRKQHEARPDSRLLVSSRTRDANWAVATIDPRSRQGGRQLDLHTARTADPELLSASIGGVPFSSCRFSRFGETLLYVQTDGFSDEGFSTTLAMEEAVDAALGPLGRTIGAGTGERYSYLNLVVANDVDAALERIRQALQKGKLPKRSWLRFFDDTLTNEWVGVWPDSPAPE